MKLSEVIERELGVCFKNTEDYRKYKDILIKNNINVSISDYLFNTNRYYVVVGRELKHGTIDNPHRTRELINFNEIDLGIKKTNVK